MKWLKRIGIGIVVFLLLLVGVAYLLPGDWSVTRSRQIAATPAEIHAYVGDWAQWPEWSPFENEDPDMVITTEDDTTSIGAKRSWVSEAMGDGSQTITTSDPEVGFQFRLEMGGRAFDGRFDYQVVEGGTVVTWTDWGELGGNPFYRWIGLLMEPMLGPSFEQGLADLDAVVTAGR